MKRLAMVSLAIVFVFACVYFLMICTMTMKKKTSKSANNIKHIDSYKMLTIKEIELWKDYQDDIIDDYKEIDIKFWKSLIEQKKCCFTLNNDPVDLDETFVFYILQCIDDIIKKNKESDEMFSNHIILMNKFKSVLVNSKKVENYIRKIINGGVNAYINQCDENEKLDMLTVLYLLKLCPDFEHIFDYCLKKCPFLENFDGEIRTHLEKICIFYNSKTINAYDNIKNAINFYITLSEFKYKKKILLHPQLLNVDFFFKKSTSIENVLFENGDGEFKIFFILDRFIEILNFCLLNHTIPSINDQFNKQITPLLTALSKTDLLNQLKNELKQNSHNLTNQVILKVIGMSDIKFQKDFFKYRNGDLQTVEHMFKSDKKLPLMSIKSKKFEEVIDVNKYIFKIIELTFYSSDDTESD